MAVYTTFFLCEPEALPGGFPRWRLPLAQPVERKVKNPGTGETSVIQTREPEWSADLGDGLDREYKIASMAGSYQAYLEGRLLPFIRGCPHWAAIGLTQVELQPLLHATSVQAPLESAIYSSPSSSAMVLQIPSDLLAKLGALDRSGLESIAEHWSKTLSAPEFTHSKSGERISDGWTLGNALETIQAVVSLARKSTDAQRLYVLVEG